MRSRVKRGTSGMMMFFAPGDGLASATVAERSMRSPSRSLCFVWVDILFPLVSERRQNLFSCRAPGRSHAANQSHRDGKQHRRNDHLQRDPDAELDLAERDLVGS